MKSHAAYFYYVLRHKLYVFRACRALHVPLWQAVLHDWTKFLPSEWGPYAAYFYGPSEPPINYGELFARQNRTATVAAWKEDRQRAFDRAWNAHQKRNRHHHQYWLLTFDDGGTKALEMPETDVREMVADWVGAGRALGKPDTRAWYAANKDKMQLHPTTRQLVEQLLGVDR